MLHTLKNRDYRYLWLGQAVSHLGDQFHLVALPWLVLALTGDPLQLGLVLALAGLPRAVLMLVGGAVADRISPRLLMLGADLIRLAITALIVVAIATDRVQVWMVYALALAFGTISGFFLPAAEATLPRVLRDEELAGGNSLMMIADQVAQFLGPALAGTVIALLAHGAVGQDGTMTGIGVAFGVDALTFAVGAFTLWRMRPLAGFGSEHHPLHDVAEGLRFVWRHGTIRILVVIIALANFLLTGPLLVGLPVLAANRLGEGAAAFGMILSGYALGNLVGMGIAGSTRPSTRLLGWVGVGIFPLLGIVYSTLALAASTWVSVLAMVVGGVANGYLAITVITMLQRMSPRHLVGRVMSLLMLSMYGLAPISQVVAGAVLQLSVTWLFLGAAIGLLVPGALALRHRTMWDFTPVTDPGQTPREATPVPVIG
ncbi:MAG: MFS transporter [Propionibacteriaceae bacterium]|nr:MFS transporter [Propionibacteriaceae bacterium]